MIHLKLYRHRGNWRWQMKRNGRIIGASTEGYKRRVDARNNLRIVTTRELYIPRGHNGHAFEWAVDELS